MDWNTASNLKRITALVGILHRLSNGTSDHKTNNIVWSAIKSELEKTGLTYADLVIAKGMLEDANP